MTVTHESETIDQVFSAALVAYLGYGTFPTPGRHARAVEAVTTAPGVLPALRAAVSTVLAHIPDDHDTEAVAAHARVVLPHLTEEAIAAVAWNYHHGWR